MENYICINGKKAELTEEQMKALGIELPKVNPFARVDKAKNRGYYFINDTGRIISTPDMPNEFQCDDARYNIANYCTDKSIMEQRALHETLNRLLWRYSMEHGGDEIEWKDTVKGYIYYNHEDNEFKVDGCIKWHYAGVTFLTKEIARNAIEEIIKPFMEAHPDFKW